MTLCEIAAKHDLPVSVVSSDPTFGGEVFTLLYEDRDARGFLYVSPDGVRGWMSRIELSDTWDVACLVTGRVDSLCS